MLALRGEPDAPADPLDELGPGLNRPLSQELLARDLARLAFIALDGTPRSIPIGIVWNGTEIVMCTATNAGNSRRCAAIPRSR